MKVYQRPLSEIIDNTKQISIRRINSRLTQKRKLNLSELEVIMILNGKGYAVLPQDRILKLFVNNFFCYETNSKGLPKLAILGAITNQKTGRLELYMVR